MTNWLDPQDVERFIGNRVCNCKAFSKDCPSCLDDQIDALEQFVRSLAAVDPSWDVRSTQRATDVARLLVRAMDGGEE